MNTYCQTWNEYIIISPSLVVIDIFSSCHWSVLANRMYSRHGPIEMFVCEIVKKACKQINSQAHWVIIRPIMCIRLAQNFLLASGSSVLAGCLFTHTFMLNHGWSFSGIFYLHTVALIYHCVLWTGALSIIACLAVQQVNRPVWTMMLLYVACTWSCLPRMHLRSALALIMQHHLKADWDYCISILNSIWFF